MNNDTLIVIIVIIVSAGLMFVLPLIIISDRVDDVAQVAIQAETDKFVKDVANKGVLTAEEYANFPRKLPSQNTYEVEAEIWVLDENPGKKTTQMNSEKVGENEYYIMYESQIENQLFGEDGTKNGEIRMMVGWIFVLRVKNITPTKSQELSPLPTSDLSILCGESSAMVPVNGN